MSNPSLYNEVANDDNYEQQINLHINLVKRIAYHLSGRLPSHIQIGDLIQSGIIGLIEAIKNFQSNKGANFQTFASIRIRGAMLDDIRRNDWIPRSVYQKGRKINEAIATIEQHKQAPATDHEIAQALNISITEYNSYLQETSCCDMYSLDISEQDIMDQSDLGIDPLTSIQKSDLINMLADHIKQLPEREQLILSLHNQEELNLKDIGAVLGISESRVCQLHSQAIKRLKTRLSRQLNPEHA